MIKHLIPTLVMAAVFYLGYKIGVYDGYKKALKFVIEAIENKLEQKEKLNALKGKNND